MPMKRMEHRGPLVATDDAGREYRFRASRKIIDMGDGDEAPGLWELKLVPGGGRLLPLEKGVYRVAATGGGSLHL